MDNPYQAPTTASPIAGSNHEISPEVIAALGGTRGWVRFIAVLGFVVTGLIFIGSLGLLMRSGRIGSSPATPGLFVGIYFGVGVLYFFASLKLNQYASKIRGFLNQTNQATLADALEAQRVFWKYVGICLLVTIAFYIVVVGLVVSRFAV